MLIWDFAIFQQKETKIIWHNLKLHTLLRWSMARPSRPTSRCPATATLNPTTSPCSAETTKASDSSSSRLKISLRREVRPSSQSFPHSYLYLFLSLPFFEFWCFAISSRQYTLFCLVFDVTCRHAMTFNIVKSVAEIYIPFLQSLRRVRYCAMKT